ncbi:MAG: hypothetical protein ACE5IR_17190 [bacterium]
MSKSKELIFDSAQSEADDQFWLEHGKKMVEDSIIAVREAAKSLIRGIGVIQAIYLGMFGFSNLIPHDMPPIAKPIFVVPLLLWLVSLYATLQVMMTQEHQIFLHSPGDIREKSEKILREKQKNLKWAFSTLAVGLVIAFALLVFCK